MIGKLIGALVGRSMAKKRGINPLLGAAAGIFGPALLKKGGSILADASKNAAEKRRERKQPVFIEPTPRRAGARPTTAGRPRRR